MCSIKFHVSNFTLLMMGPYHGERHTERCIKLSLTVGCISNLKPSPTQYEERIHMNPIVGLCGSTKAGHLEGGRGRRALINRSFVPTDAVFWERTLELHCIGSVSQWVTCPTGTPLTRSPQGHAHWVTRWALWGFLLVQIVTSEW